MTWRERFQAWRQRRAEGNAQMTRLLTATEEGSLIWRRQHVDMYSTSDEGWIIDVDIKTGRVLMSDDEMVLECEIEGRTGTKLVHAIVRSAHPGITDTDLIHVV